ncbi:type IV toxin-antitoxin system AbiEi family antitoxin domain-containing protein [Bacteroidales bacterium OttesenSCG-928-I14]|nr:type IV toxin-antitoxin system AbiEi family antitoxin domain-containing protein [Bacteroidales bacterium OttesenSCG-928-I14]
MQSIHQQILAIIHGFERGKIFFPEQFDHLGSNESIRQALSRICKDGIIIRLSKGVYLSPVIDSELGVLYPSVDTVAKAIAARDKARIIPTGAYALNRLGLSTQVPMNVVYLTDGTPRKIKIDRQTITFKQTAPKNFSFKGEIAPLVVSALKEIGKDNVTDKDLEQVYKALKMESIEIVISDAYIAPRWITDIILSLINESENA